ncbi:MULTISPECIES: Crp/Fnr family transcriptional regulator [Psychrilyobacter]|uniref:Crp/Fnr family transcriptional regulator n=1 Tax=Psychrilyobacter piezotolerans TaxID=2293438 RepID=A0ABX9KES6_9FUSO|nr:MULTISPECIES: Crp/Fnr family transcriptional regulator [Psychrilyobacter]MCS5423178.1 Crp/Fnr family transcriptional regulator [Psychrilyobacter sp. S5]NDI78629.1 Crp/Fnr family transcriptional regulator [Psychrilyobacter piezotolerans]RDE59980.1 Crp/Fnr family transcriptional regulator [Psychrilyobacter sp. S5]REI40207.1 Crp/Fnr family transcriptional regulator [Psychrilyobacter piezotolerans]
MDIFEKLKNVEIFKGIDDENLKTLLIELKYKVKKFDKNEVVAFRGDEIKDLIIVTEGEVYTEMQKLNGDSIVVDRLPEGSVLAGAFIFGKDNRFPVDVVTASDSELIYISKDEVIRMFQLNERLLQNYLGVISNKTQFLSKKIWFSFTNKSINNKLIAYLLNNMNRNNYVLLQNSMKEIAQMFGVARPSLSRVLKEFIDEGVIIRKEKNLLEIPSKDVLLEKVD